MHCSAFIWQFPILQGGVVLGKSLRVLSFVMLLAVLVAAETIPAGTRITMRTQSQINSGSARSGQSFNKSHTKSNVTKIGGGAAAGALIGGLVGGGKGALIGTAAGAGAGTGVAAATGKQEAVVHAESALTFTLSSPASTR
ncbi:MAG: hypothetical protein DMG91_11915 [Acidobacteria bacterium]|nr:MAG: hypothetical protein DMG91_11915 [Acidobacteriota bacterium]